MNYEERYNQALEIAKYYHDRDNIHFLEHIFPELKESENERISKEIIQFLQLPHPQFVGKRNYEEWIAWLEKQGAKKDTVTPQWMIDFLKEHRRHFATPMDYDEKKETDGGLVAVIKWLEGNPQIEQKPQPRWKPTEEQISELGKAAILQNVRFNKSILESLYNDLKTLI